ncbi:MAG: acyl-CoA dehydrogenase [Gammaproteobacteria bacterium]|jgi:alkylation response protein AidB-like acyl-CoA dehydrogenase|nr:acyl-CoA dehydrogenase [Gammaproteobacteria bacterium]
MAVLNEEQTMLKDQAEAWVNEVAPVRAFRTLRDSGSDKGWDPAVWSAMVEMGWTGIVVPESLGGSDLGYLTFGVLLEQTGRQLTASPLLASALIGASAVRLGGTDAQQRDWLPGIVDGSTILSLAVDEGNRHAPEQTALVAEAAGDGYRLSGSKTLVPEGGEATAFVVAARTAGAAGDRDGITLFLVPGDLAGIERQRLSTFDARGYANVGFDGVEVGKDSVLGDLNGGFPLLDAVLDRARAGLAAEMLGTASAAFDMTLDYLQTRRQFGAVIGSFQALGHRAAGLYSQKELARSCVEAALEALDKDADDAAQLCSLAKAKAGDFLFNMSNELIQIHGGIGMTDEFDAGFYLKRARAVESLYGNRAFHRDRYATLLGF